MDEELQPAGAIIQQTQPQLSQQRRRCGNCGSIHHANRSPNCPAIGQKCRHCGAKVSLLNMATYKKCFSDVKLQPSPLKLCGYGQASIAVIGAVKLPVQHGQKCLPEFPFYITNILGLDLFLSLDFSLHDNSGAAILQVDSPWQTQFLCAA
ncbi:hypothetical protein QQF64_034158 [Cirrhinus molitorella]|uniref:Uncharacterized protein n=1 Tax=Cirrhinus molitorella TaxID=172907 RepID=A0ABR3MW71_9TELE